MMLLHMLHGLPLRSEFARASFSEWNLLNTQTNSPPGFSYFRSLGFVLLKTKRGREEALSIVMRLVAGLPAGVIETRVDSVVLEPLVGGRSGAYVFKLTPMFGAGHQTKLTPVVIKIAPRARGLAEKAKYERYVRSGLPAACRSELLAFAGTRERLGLCYEYVGGRDGARLETLTDHLQRGDGATLALVLRRLFAPLRDTWYSPAQVRGQRDIARTYLERYFPGPRGAAKHEAALRACAKKYFKAEWWGGRCRIGGVEFPSPHAVLFAAARKRPYHSCILHGDLNTDNIVVAPRRARGQAPARRRVTLIDFEKTGRGHVYQDLASLEQSVRINHPRDASYRAIMEIERLIALGRRPPGANPYADAILSIRKAAWRTFGRVEDRATYHFAIAALGLRLMQATDLTDTARARITISALWAAKALAGESLE